MYTHLPTTLRTGVGACSGVTGVEAWDMYLFDVIFINISFVFQDNPGPAVSRQSFGCYLCCSLAFGSKSERLKQSFTLLKIERFLKVLGIVGKSLPHPVGVFPMLPDPPKWQIMQNQRKIQIP